jgi:outer membrane immunogenic protein
MFKRMPLFLALCVGSAAAFAANAASADWTGWHVGVHAGHASGDSDADVTLGGQWAIEPQSLRDHVTNTWSDDMEPSGAAYGLQFGYDHQFPSGFVLGAEIDYSHLGLDDSRSTGLQPVPTSPGLSYNFSNAVELDSQISARLRLGFASGRHLFYLTGGWTEVDVEAAAAVASNGGYLKAGGASESLDGAIWGAGYEFDFGNQWSLRAEYLMTDVDDLEFDTGYLPGSTFVSPAYTEHFRQDADFDVIRIGITYRF